MTDESQLVAHAREELQRAGLFDEDSDYGGMVGATVMQLIEGLDSQGHTGMSLAMVRTIFEKVSNFETLTPITDEPDEWIDRSDLCSEPTWQNRRDPSYFSNDGGKTHYRLTDRATPRKVDLRDDGILWYVNRTALHPRGFALGVDSESGELQMFGDGSQLWSYDLDEESNKVRFDAMLKRISAIVDDCS